MCERHHVFNSLDIETTQCFQRNIITSSDEWYLPELEQELHEVFNHLLSGSQMLFLVWLSFASPLLVTHNTTISHLLLCWATYHNPFCIEEQHTVVTSYASSVLKLQVTRDIPPCWSIHAQMEPPILGKEKKKEFSFYSSGVVLVQSPRKLWKR